MFGNQLFDQRQRIHGRPPMNRVRASSFSSGTALTTGIVAFQPRESREIPCIPAAAASIAGTDTPSSAWARLPRSHSTRSLMTSRRNPRAISADAALRSTVGNASAGTAGRPIGSGRSETRSEGVAAVDTLRKKSLYLLGEMGVKTAPWHFRTLSIPRASKARRLTAT